MGRSIAAAVLGYVAMVLFVLVGTAVQWAVLGAEGAFKEGTVVASTSWSFIAMIAGGLAAICGGLVASWIDKSNNKLGPKILVVFVLVAGFSHAAMQMTSKPEPLPEEKQIAEMSFADAAKYAVSPPWFNWLIPVIGIAGAWGGANISFRTKTAEAT